MDSPLGLAGQRALGTIWLASHTPWTSAERDALLDDACNVASRHELSALSGATALDPRLVLMRVLAPRVWRA